MAEIECIRRTLTSVRGNQQKAAERLKVSHKTLKTKIEEYGIELPSGDAANEPRDRRTR